MKFFIVLLSCFYLCLSVLAQDPRQPDDPRHLTESGKLFQVQVIPSQKETKIFVIGKKTAQINFNQLQIEAKLILGNEEKRLVLKRKKDHFVTSQLFNADELRLKLETKDHKNLEEIKIKLNLKN